MGTNMLNVGIIGCGGIGMTHARAYAKLANVKLAAMIDFNFELAQKAAAQFGAQAFRSIDECDIKLDLVSVVTPPSTHFKVVMELLERGIPVFCEKPITMDIEQAKLLEKKSEETGIPIGVGFKMRNEAVFAKAKELIGEVGRILAVSVVKNQPQSPNPAKAWVKDTGCMYELSVHDYDLIHYIMGAYPVSVEAKLGYRHGWNREDQAYLTVEYDNGAIGQLMSAYTTTASWTYQDIAITFVGENGYMRVERPNRIVLATDTQRVVEVTPLDGEEPFRIELEGFVNSLLNKTHFHPDVHDGVVTTVLVESANRSHREGKAIEIQ